MQVLGGGSSDRSLLGVGGFTPISDSPRGWLVLRDAVVITVSSLVSGKRWIFSLIEYISSVISSHSVVSVVGSVRRGGIALLVPAPSRGVDSGYVIWGSIWALSSASFRWIGKAI